MAPPAPKKKPSKAPAKKGGKSAPPWMKKDKGGKKQPGKKSGDC